ncbi:MAG TPA: glycosyltransferase family 39 protein [Gemmatimonadaceae bacterium]|nr:glycosyltransferase family 39 protein [Gemmatimonadaceae bacterium]
MQAADAPRPPLAVGLVASIAGIKLLTHLITIAITPYGIHRDEFLYLAMGQYLRFWSMDFPPLIAVLANTARALFGDTLFAIRLLPAVAGTALIVLAAMIARELGGRRLAQGIAAFTVLLVPVFLRPAALFQPVVFDQLWWTLGFLALVKISRTGEPRWWLLLGAAGGLGLLTKFSVGFFAVGVLAGLLLTPQRRWLASRWPYATAALALIIGSASVAGQIRLGFPVAGYMGELQEAQLARVNAAEFLGGQLMLLGPALLLAIAGLIHLFRAQTMQPYRIVGWTCVTIFVLLLVMRGKPYYVAPIYPALLAAGGVSLEAVSSGLRRVLVPAFVVVMLAAGIVGLPFGLPVVRPEPMARYSVKLGLTSAVTTNRGVVLPLPQDYADMLGWEEMVAAVSRHYHQLPREDRALAVIIGSNYGEAGALDFYGPRYGLPRAISTAGTYWFFGPGDLPGDVAITVGIEAGELAPFFRSARVLERIDDPWLVPEQRDNPIVIAGGPYRTLQEVWPSLAQPD